MGTIVLGHGRGELGLGLVWPSLPLLDRTLIPYCIVISFNARVSEKLSHSIKYPPMTKDEQSSVNLSTVMFHSIFQCQITLQNKNYPKQTKKNDCEKESRMGLMTEKKKRQGGPEETMSQIK